MNQAFMDWRWKEEEDVKLVTMDEGNGEEYLTQNYVILHMIIYSGKTLEKNSVLHLNRRASVLQPLFPLNSQRF